jgi:hypothetical protein
MSQSKPSPPKNLSYGDFVSYAFSPDEIKLLLAAVGENVSAAITDREKLRVDLTNDFTAFAISRANAETYSVATQKAIDRLHSARKKAKVLLDEAMNNHFQNTWLLNKAWDTWPGHGEKRLIQIHSALHDLDRMMAAADLRGYRYGMSLEVQFLGLTLPTTFEIHFARSYKISRTANQTPSGPAFRFTMECLRLKKVLNSVGRAFTAETILAHRSQALRTIKAHPELAIARAPVMVVDDVALDTKLF